MNLKSIVRLAAILTVFASATINVNAARRVVLRPLSAKEVVRILKTAGRVDAIPEGRVVTQGLAAMTGFALGLTKGIGGSIIFNLASSNATSEFINNFNYTGMMGDFQGINMTALTNMFKWGSANTSSTIKYKTTEICFNTRIEDPVEEVTTTGVADGTADITYANTGTGAAFNTGTDSITNTITQTTNGDDQTCIVLQKPIVRKRRSSHRRR